MTTRLPHGSWPSPVPIDALVGGTVRFADPRFDGEDVCWLEGRPANRGRQTLVRLRAGAAAGTPGEDLTPPDVNVRDRVHEYGGAPYLVDEGIAWYSEFADARLFRRDPDGSVRPLVPAGPYRYADLVRDRGRGRLVAVREDHTDPSPAGVVNELVAIPEGGGEPVVLVAGADFYANPRLSPDGTRLAWIEWDHPNLPWDETSLHVGRFGPDGSLVERVRVAGEPGESVIQPRWSADGTLHVVAERSGWWNLYRWDEDAGGATDRTAGRLVPIAPLPAEVGAPQWVFGTSNWDFLGDGRIVASARAGGHDRLLVIDPATGTVEERATPYTELVGIAASGERVLFIGGSPTRRYEVAVHSIRDGTTTRVAGEAEPPIAPELVSVGVPIEFPTAGGRSAHGILYAPHLPGHAGLEGERPPLVVTSHGGPTAAASTALSLFVQLLTSRGIAVLDVDYGGSTGYGREYRKRLERTWGVTDVEDCVAGARWLAAEGRVDPARMAIRGGSASGFTTLAALCFTDAFAAGVSHFGVTDLETFVHETHKFESRYLDSLLGPYPASADVYRDRSPIHHVDGIRAAVLVTQGLDDRIVPPAQAERIVAALAERGIPHAALYFEGEDHGYRQARSIVRSFEAELSFYGQVFGFVPADPFEPIVVEHLPSR